MTEKRVKISTIVDNQIPSYVREDYPIVVEFLKQYYKAQEYQGGPVDVITNIDKYSNIENLTNNIDNVTLGGSINSTQDVITVGDATGTDGFPDSYGLLKIDDEIITYTSKDQYSFRGCVRGFSGLTSYKNNNQVDEIVFNQTKAARHSRGANIVNVSNLFLNIFLDKIKSEISPGFENIEFSSSLNEETFLKQIRSFYSSKGTEESFKILFKALYGVNVEVVTPADNLFKPSDSVYVQLESIVVEPIEGDPLKLYNNTLFQDYPSKAYAPITYVESINAGLGKTYYRLDIDAGYDRDSKFKGSTYGVFLSTPKTKVVSDVSIGSTIIDVDSTVGFAATGNIRFTYKDGSTGELYYNNKNLTQFTEIDFITKEIGETAEVIDKDVFTYANVGGENIKCNITTVINKINVPDGNRFLKEGSKTKIKSVGHEGLDFRTNDWFFNNRPNYTVKTIEVVDLTDNSYLVKLFNEHFFKKGDKIDIIDNSSKVTPCIVSDAESDFNFKVKASERLKIVDDTIIQNSYVLKKSLLRGNSKYFPEVASIPSNVQNVYIDDGSQTILTASSSVPSETISLESVEYDVTGTFEGEVIEFVKDHSFYSGDLVYYTPEFETLYRYDEFGDYVSYQNVKSYLLTEGNYFAHRLDNRRIKLAQSKENIFKNKFVSFPRSTVKNNKIALSSLNGKGIQNQKLLREIPINPKNSTVENPTQPGKTGILVNGVEILNYKSDENIFFGEIKNINVTQSSNTFDIVNPPELIVEDEVGVGATGFVAVSGSLDSIKIIDRGHDYQDTPVISISGGNGSGANVRVNMQTYTHSEPFNAHSRGDVGLGTVSKIGFTTYHKFRDHEEVIYRTNGQRGIAGITTNSNYFVKSTSPTNLCLFLTLEDSIAGINTITFTAYGQGSHHLEAVEKKKRLDSINVMNGGSGYATRKISISHEDVDYSNNTLVCDNHGYNSGDKIQYLGVTTTTHTPLTGLQTSTDYFVTKISENSFKLSEIGENDLDEDYFYRRKLFVGITTTGLGKHIFNSPPINVNLVGKTFIGEEFEAKIQPHFRGSIDSVSILDNGVGYGTNDIINFERKPNISHTIGKGAQIRAIVNNGSVVEAIILDKGKDFKSPPDLIVGGDGDGAVLTAIVEDGKLQDIKIIEGGRNYDQDTTTITAISPESLSVSKFDGQVRSWRINLFEKYFSRFQKDDGVLIQSDFGKYGLQYTHMYPPRYLRRTLNPISPDGRKLYGISDLPFNRTEIKSNQHSPIIGWAYDGNPIYGPYGFSSKSGGIAVQMRSGYRKVGSNNPNRPSGYQSGFFVEDYKYFDVADEDVLDRNNGRFCVTPEYPNGTYAYFSTINESSSDITGVFEDYRRPVFPYFIGENYYSQVSDFNFSKESNQDDFNLNQSPYLRNTGVYNLTDGRLTYPYITLPNTLSQSTTVKTTKKGKIDSVTVENGGVDYKVGDKIRFSIIDSYTNPASAKVSLIKGKTLTGVSCTTYSSNIDIHPTNILNQYIAISTTPHNYNNGSTVVIAGISSSKFEFSGSYDVKVTPSTFRLTKQLETVANTGISTYLHLSMGNLRSLTNNDIIQIDNEKFKLIDVDHRSYRVRVIREFDGSTSGIHTVGVGVTLLNRKFIFNSDLNESKFDPNKIKQNREVYFDPNEVLGIGIGSTSVFSNPGLGITSLFIPKHAIYLKNHRFSTGDILTYHKNDITPTFDIFYRDNAHSGLGTALLDGQNLHVAKISDNFIGLSTVRVGLGTTGQFSGVTTTTSNIGLLEWAGIGTLTSEKSNTFNSFTTNYDSIKGLSTKNLVTVETDEPHSLHNGHRINLTLNPKTDKTVAVAYNKYHKKLIIDPKVIDPESVDPEKNTIRIEDHGLSNGQKVIYTTDVEHASISDNTILYVIKLDDDTIQLSSNRFFEANNDYSAVGISSHLAELGAVNPNIISRGDRNIIFDLSSDTLQYKYLEKFYPAFKFELYEDKNYLVKWDKDEGTREFNLSSIGQVGKSAQINLKVTSNTPKELFYKIVPIYTDGVPLPSDRANLSIDRDVFESGKITLADSLYNGLYKINSTDTNQFTFDILSVPERVSYGSTNADFSYVTDCVHTSGEIHSIQVTNSGSNYTSIPKVLSIETENGKNALLEANSSEIGEVVDINNVDYGYNFPYDTSLNPLIFYPQVLSVKPFSKLKSIKVNDLGVGLTKDVNDLVVVDSVYGFVADEVTLHFDKNYDNVDIITNTSGISNSTPLIYPVGSGAGVRLSDMTYDSSTRLVTATLNAEYSLGDPYPFEIGDEVMVEGAVSVHKDMIGFNSKDYDYRLFTLTGIHQNFGGAVGVVTFSLKSELGVGKTISEFDTINSRARMIPKKHFPTFEVELAKNEFIPGEDIVSLTDSRKVAKVESWDSDHSTLIISSNSEFPKDELILSNSSKLRAIVFDSVSNFKVHCDYGTVVKRNVGWLDVSGFLNSNLQRMPDNDYYQNFSYSLKATIPYDEWNTAVTSLNHVSGYKKYSDYQLESYEKSSSNVPTTTMTPRADSADVNFIKDTTRVIDVNCVTDFDIATENAIIVNDQVASTEIIFNSKYIKNFQESVTNRVVEIDDISPQFNHRPRPEEYVSIDDFRLSKARCIKYIALVRDTRFTSERQISVFDIVHDNTFGYINEYARLNTIKDLGSFDFVIEEGIGNIRYYPEDEKINYNDYSISYISYKLDDNTLGIGQTAIGPNALYDTSSTKFTPSDVGIAKTIVSIGSTYHSLTMMVSVNPDEDLDNIEFSYTNINFVHDGTTVYSSGDYGSIFTDATTISTIDGYGEFAGRIVNDKLNIEFTPNSGIGTTCAVNTIHIGIATAPSTSAGITTMYLDHIDLETRTVSIAASATPTENVIGSYYYIEGQEEFHGARHIVHAVDKTNNIHQGSEILTLDTINAVGINTFTEIVEYGVVDTTADMDSSGIGTFGVRVAPDGFTVELTFTPLPNIDAEVNVLSHNIKSERTTLGPVGFGFENATLTTNREMYLGTYNVIKRNFDLTHGGAKIFESYFDGSNPEIVRLTDSSINIPNHFFITGEKIKYNRFNVNVADSAIGIALTTFPGIGATTVLPEDLECLYAIKTSDDSIRLATSAENALSPVPVPIEFTNVGTGNSHRFVTTNQNARVMLTIDNIIQKPIVATSVTTALSDDLSTISDIVNVTGITSFTGADIIKIGDELMKIQSVGIDTNPNLFRVSRARLASKLAFHTAGTTVTKIIGNYNIVDNLVSFAEAPYGKDPLTDPSNPNELDWTGIATGSYFHGRTFMKGPILLNTDHTYSKNYVFDDISHLFTGSRKAFPIKSSGQDITGIHQQNSVSLINNVLQIPGEDIDLHSYKLVGVNSTTELHFNGDPAKITGDSGTTTFPINGIIQSVGSTEGYGYQPRISAAGTAIVASYGAVTSVSVAYTGSGYRAKDRMVILSTVTSDVGVGETVFKIHNENGLYQLLDLLYDGSNSKVSIGTYIDATQILEVGSNFVTIGIAETTNNIVESGTPVRVLIDNPPVGIVNVSVATSSINKSIPEGILYDVTNASYTPATGVLSLTLPSDHILEEGAFIKLNDNSIYFTCTSDNNATPKSYPRPGLDNISYNNKLRVNSVNGNDIEVYVGITTAVTYDVSDASYDAVTGILDLTIGSHNLIPGRGISIETDSLTFTCGMDSNASNHTYPRATDPAGGKTIDVVSVTDTTISVNVGPSPILTFTPTDADYNPVTGLMELTIGAHTLTAGTSIKLAPNSLTFRCAQDNYSTDHTYPRTTDPFYDTSINIESVTATTITIQVLSSTPSTNTSEHRFISATAGAVITGGNYIHTFVSATSGAVVAGGDYIHSFTGIGTAAVVTTSQVSSQHVGFATIITGQGRISENVTITDPIYVGNSDIDVIFDEPRPYNNLELIYSSSNAVTGVGSFAKVDIVVGNGSSISEYSIINSGFGFGDDEILTVETGGLTGIPTTSNADFREFQLVVDRVESDDFGGWSIGDLLLLDNVDAYVDGVRKVFPLMYQGESISIIAARGSKISPDQLLLVFVNNILQIPNKSYIFNGGSRIRFTEPLRNEDRLNIIFYRGNGESDLNDIDVIQSVKIGDTVTLQSNSIALREDPRLINDITSTDTIETLPYYGPGNIVSVETTRPIDYCRQSKDLIIDGFTVSKARTFYEPIINPFTHITKSVGIGSTTIYVNTVRPLFNQNNENPVSLDFQNEIMFVRQEEGQTAKATATVSASGEVTSITITDQGEGYSQIPTVSIASTNGVGFSTNTTAKATATLSGDGRVSGIAVDSPGVGYTSTNPPAVMVSPPTYKQETCQVSSYHGDFGTIVGFATTSISNETYMIFDLKISDVFLNTSAVGIATTVSELQMEDVFSINGSIVGSSTTSITSYDHDNNILGISTSYIDGVYEASEANEVIVNINGLDTPIRRVHVRADNLYEGFDFTQNSGMTTSYYFGNYEWGKIKIVKRADQSVLPAYNSNGYTGITTSPIVIRKEPLRYYNYS